MNKYSNNRKILDEVIEKKQIIRNISEHLKPDGTFDIEGNLKKWNSIIDKFEKIQLWEEGVPGYNESTELQPQPSIIFIPSPSGDSRGTIIVAHGGGFLTRTGHEGFHTADYFNKVGYAVAILTYRINPYTRLDAIADMQMAVRILRSRAKELEISDKIAVMGFSAGGMLSANCATLFDYGNKNAANPVERYSCRPDAAVIGYGSFSFAAFPETVLSQKLGGQNRAEIMHLSPDKNITVETPPFFIWQTTNELDDPRYALNLAKELTDYGIPFELHIFPQGGHGLGLADGDNDLGIKISHVKHWSKLCEEWLEELGF